MTEERTTKDTGYPALRGIPNSDFVVPKQRDGDVITRANGTEVERPIPIKELTGCDDQRVSGL